MPVLPWPIPKEMHEIEPSLPCRVTMLRQLQTLINLSDFGGLRFRIILTNRSVTVVHMPGNY
jgi:hypothetical protein